jgi:glycosyltransferase involved in cell wall biosynthesis
VDVRIGILGSRGIPASYGGFETLAEQLALHLAAKDFQIFVTGFDKHRRAPRFLSNSNLTTITVFAIGPKFLHNFLSTWRASRLLRKQIKLDAVIVLNDVNYFVARKYWKMGVVTILHLDGAEARRSGLPIIGKLAHWFFRQLAIRSGVHLVVDSVAIKEDLKSSSQKMAVISYAPHFDVVKKPEHLKINLESKRFFLAIARFVEENQLIELIDAFISSGLDEQLLVIGLGTGSKKYENRAFNAAKGNENIHLLPKNYDRSEINWLLQNAKGYIHGHSVGGTNPILVDARLHAQLILSHDNPYNRENSGYKEHFWTNNDQLTNLLKSIDSLGVRRDASDYALDSWETIALQYLELLTKRD